MFKPAGFCLRVLLVISRRMDYNKSSNKLLHKEDMDMQAKYVVKKVSAPDWETIPAVTLTHTPWLTPNAVEAKAQACHDGERLYVRMQAKESAIRATYTDPLAPVCCDSCLEFFFAPSLDDARYFNFEWNPLGAIYLGFGAARNTRVRQLVKDVSELFAPKPFYTDDGWGIEFSIPASYIKMYMPEFELSGGAACNFYKCGDMTEVPHYLAWSPLTSKKPDYHRRQDFAEIAFE